LGLFTRPFDPTMLFVDSLAPPASSDLSFGSDARKHPSNHISIFYAPFLNPSTPSLCSCYPISARLPPTIVLIPSLLPVHPSHPHIKNRIRTSTHQKLFGRDTSALQATHIYSTITLIFLSSLQVVDKFESHKPSTSHYLHHHHHQIHHNFQFPPTTHQRKYLPHAILQTTMPSRSKRPTRKSPPEVAPAPYPPFGCHPSDPSTIPPTTNPSVAPRSLST
jgi:hypothetical protein